MSILAQADLAPSTNNLVLETGVAAICNLLLVNRTGAIINVSIALVPSGTASPAAQHWIEYQVPLDGNMPLERGAIPIASGDRIFINPSAGGVSCTIVAINI